MNYIHPTAIIYQNVTLGKGNHIGPYCIIGSPGDIRGKDRSNFNGKVIIGDNNVFSDSVKIHVPFEGDTVIGNDNFIMSGVYIAHNVEIGSNVEVCAGSVIGGYSKIESGVRIKMNCTIRNRITIGENSVVGMGSVVTKDVEPNVTVYGNPAIPRPLRE